MKDLIINILHNPIYMFVACLILHIYSDFHLQGILGSYKCKDYWNIPDNPMPNKYWKDWISALIIHSIEWGIITFLPMAFTLCPIIWCIIVLGNAFIHAIVDHMKANLGIFNLNQDQITHFLQIVATMIFWFITTRHIM